MAPTVEEQKKFCLEISSGNNWISQIEQCAMKGEKSGNPKSFCVCARNFQSRFYNGPRKRISFFFPIHTKHHHLQWKVLKTILKSLRKAKLKEFSVKLSFVILLVAVSHVQTFFAGVLKHNFYGKLEAIMALKHLQKTATENVVIRNTFCAFPSSLYCLLNTYGFYLRNTIEISKFLLS